MNPREIEVHIDELVLHGVDPQLRWRIAERLESELCELLGERGLPQAWLSNPERLDAGVVQQQARGLPLSGDRIAKAIYKGGKR